MWLVYREMTGGGRKLLHGRNGHEYMLPELPHFSVDGFRPGTKTVYEFLGCYYDGHTCQTYRNLCRMRGDTLAVRYERTMGRIEEITRVFYHVERRWECAFDEEILSCHPEMKTHPVVVNIRLNTRDALYGDRTEVLKFHYKVREVEETIRGSDES